MFRTVVNSFLLEGQIDGRTDRRTDIASNDIRYFFQERKKNAKNLHKLIEIGILPNLNTFPNITILLCTSNYIGLWI